MTNLLTKQIEISNEQKNTLKQTYFLMGISLFFSAIAAMIGTTFMPALGILGVLTVFVITIGLIMYMGKVETEGNKQKTLVILFSIATLLGLSLSALIAAVLTTSGPGIIVNSFIGAGLIFLTMSVFSLKAGDRFFNYGKLLFISLLVIVVIALMNLFLGIEIVSVVVSSLALIIFSGFILYETQEIINKRTSPESGALSLYLSFINIFSSLLNLFHLND